MNPDKQAPQPRTPKFKEVVELDKPMTIDEAIAKLMEFHKTSRESILSAFFNLNKFVEGGNEGTVVFHQGARAESLIIRFTRNGKEEISNDLINKYTGQPMQHVG